MEERTKYSLAQALSHGPSPRWLFFPLGLGFLISKWEIVGRPVWWFREERLPRVAEVLWRL